jgi:hypothetical protein
MTPKSDIAMLNEASVGCEEDEEEPEVIVENEDLEITIEANYDDEDASVDGEKTEKSIESEELTVVVSADPNEKDAERNVNDVSSQETHEPVKWTDMVDQEETEEQVDQEETKEQVDQEETKEQVIFVNFLHLQLLVSFKFQDVQYCDKLHVHHSYRLNCRKCGGTLFASLSFTSSFCIIIPHLAEVLEMNVKGY